MCLKDNLLPDETSRRDEVGWRVRRAIVGSVYKGRGTQGMQLFCFLRAKRVMAEIIGKLQQKGCTLNKQQKYSVTIIGV